MVIFTVPHNVVRSWQSYAKPFQFHVCILCSMPTSTKPLSSHLLLDFSLTVKAAPHECVIRTSQPLA